MAINHGLGGQKTRDLKHCLRTLQTNGIATIMRFGS
jgi:hypothetical protein